MRLLIIIFAFALIACKQTKSYTSETWRESNDLTHLSKELLSRGQTDSAAPLIKKALELDPSNYEAYNNRAYLKVMMSAKPEDVLADYQKALELKPDYDIGLYSIANYYLSIQDYPKVIEFATKLLNLPNKREVDSASIGHIYAIRGESYSYQLQFDKAIADLKIALNINPSSAGAWKNLADCYFYRDNNTEIATHLYTRALLLDSNYYQSYLGRAQCYEKSTPRQLEAAYSDYLHALIIEPTAGDIYNTNSSLFKKARQEVKEREKGG